MGCSSCDDSALSEALRPSVIHHSELTKCHWEHVVSEAGSSSCLSHLTHSQPAIKFLVRWTPMEQFLIFGAVSSFYVSVAVGKNIAYTWQSGPNQLVLINTDKVRVCFLITKRLQQVFLSFLVSFSKCSTFPPLQSIRMISVLSR